MDFVQKPNFFLSAFLTEMILEKFVFRYCRKKRMILRGKIEVFKRFKKWTFSKRLVHGFCAKIGISLIAVFYRNFVRRNRFSIFMKENNYFLTKKLKFHQGPKNEHFLKGLGH